jgi:hypothetical protein
MHVSMSLKKAYISVPFDLNWMLKLNLDKPYIIKRSKIIKDSKNYCFKS